MRLLGQKRIKSSATGNDCYKFKGSCGVFAAMNSCRGQVLNAGTACRQRPGRRSERPYPDCPGSRMSGCAAGISSSGNASSGMRTAPLSAELVADSTSNTASVIRRSVKRTGFIDLPEISGRQPPGASWVAGTLPFSGTPFSFSAAAIACGSVTSSRIRALPFDPVTVALFFR
mgnify:CR=1 FL=1